MDIQGLLLQMRAEQREDHNALSDKVEEGFKTIAAATSKHELEDTNRFNAIDNRLEVVENTRRTFVWLASTAIVAILGAVFDFFFVHLPHLVK